MTPNMNLDYLCMETAQTIVNPTETDYKDVEKYATTGLGILKEHGPYALILYYQKEKSPVSSIFQSKLFELVSSKTHLKLLSYENDEWNFKDAISSLQAISKTLDSYLLLKKIWEQTLLYTRYHAKALIIDPDQSNYKENIS